MTPSLRFPDPRPRLVTLRFGLLSVALVSGIVTLLLREAEGFVLIAAHGYAEAVPAMLTVELGGLMFVVEWAKDRRDGIPTYKSLPAWAALAAAIASAFLNYLSGTNHAQPDLKYLFSQPVTVACLSLAVTVVFYALAEVWARELLAYEDALAAWLRKRTEWENDLAEQERKRAERRQAAAERRQERSAREEVLAEPAIALSEALPQALPPYHGNPEDKDGKVAYLADLLQRFPKATRQQVATALGCSERTIGNYLQEIRNEKPAEEAGGIREGAAP